ncbi:putative oxidoreductase [Aminobacter niigataensis]|uniref:Oxidoreductase n=1 Tax=Aminobacter niigataensis TaxID=83265 RepID=A0ABR6KVV0_9HYPH|nr:DoxX family protein [Aminobacter niigataensis]MBB4648647.1 putative oxidoreductase [Aminobacter niigataensis]
MLEPSTLAFFGRLLLGGAFVFAGLRNIANAKLLAGMMGARGVPQARLVLWAGIVLQTVAGSMLIAGFQAPYAAAALIAFLICGTLMFHNFWDHVGPERAARINGIVGNVALAGSFLFVIAVGQ